MVSTLRFELGPHWWEASALTTAPLVDLTAQPLVDTLTDKLQKAKPETLEHTLSKVETRQLVGMLPFTLTDFEFEILRATLGNLAAAAQVDKPRVRLAVALFTTLGQTKVNVYLRH